MKRKKEEKRSYLVKHKTRRRNLHRQEQRKQFQAVVSLIRERERERERLRKGNEEEDILVRKRLKTLRPYVLLPFINPQGHFGFQFV
jgi:hypothetical protein